MARLTRKQTWIVTAGLAVVLAGAGTGTAIAAGGGSDATDNGSDTSISGPALQKASAAALAYTGGGKVTETEVSDEDSYYEVEVTMPDGEQVDVQLDRAFTVVGSSSDSEAGDGDSAGDN